MVLAAAESSVASVLGAVFAGVGLALTALIAYFTLRRARTGPDPVPRWSFDPATGTSHALRLSGTDVHDVNVDISAARVDGQTTFPRFHANQVALISVVRSWGDPIPRITVTYRLQPNSDPQTWQSDVVPAPR